jgi:hypothetical protein
LKTNAEEKERRILIATKADAKTNAAQEIWNRIRIHVEEQERQSREVAIELMTTAEMEIRRTDIAAAMILPSILTPQQQQQQQQQQHHSHRSTFGTLKNFASVSSSSSSSSTILTNPKTSNCGLQKFKRQKLADGQSYLHTCVTIHDTNLRQVLSWRYSSLDASRTDKVSLMKSSSIMNNISEPRGEEYRNDRSATKDPSKSKKRTEKNCKHKQIPTNTESVVKNATGRTRMAVTSYGWLAIGACFYHMIM